MPAPDGPQFSFAHSTSSSSRPHPLEYLSLRQGDKELSRVTYSQRPGVVRVDYLNSYQEGQGHARALMEELYKRHPDTTIAWGRTSGPASQHLAEDFHERHKRTTWVPTGDGESWNTQEVGTHA